MWSAMWSDWMNYTLMHGRAFGLALPLRQAPAKRIKGRPAARKP